MSSVAGLQFTKTNRRAVTSYLKRAQREEADLFKSLQEKYKLKYPQTAC